MQQIFHEIKIITNGQGLYDFTKTTISWINDQKIKNGILKSVVVPFHASGIGLIEADGKLDATPSTTTGFILIILLVSKSKAKLLVNFNEFCASTVKNGLVTLKVNVSPTFLCKVPKVRPLIPSLKSGAEEKLIAMESL